jgi:CheY-like chemotaxis protein/HPt (histidine-containing phosphotransfer) domain-containing protein
VTAGGPEDPRSALLPLFAVEADRRLDVIDAGLTAERRDFRTLVREAHTVRGSAAVLGLDEVAEEAERLEDTFARARSDPGELDPDEAQLAVRRIRTLLAAVRVPEAVRRADFPTPAAPGPLVLCVEDSDVNARLFERILQARGAAVVAAGSGEDACRLAFERRPDVVLLDLHLPDMSGEQVARCLAARPETRGIPIVVVTGGADEGRFEALLAFGIRGVLQKPFTPRELVAAVDAALAES